MVTELEADLTWFWIRLLVLQVYSPESDFCMAENVRVSSDTGGTKKKRLCLNMYKGHKLLVIIVLLSYLPCISKKQVHSGHIFKFFGVFFFLFV